MSEISNNQPIKIDDKVFEKLDKILREPSKDDKTPIRILSETLKEMKKTVGMDFSYVTEHLIYRRKHEYTFSLSRKQDETVFTVAISNDGMDPLARAFEYINISKKESDARNRNAIKTFLDHKVEKNNYIHTFILILFKQLLELDYIVTKIEQSVKYEITFDNKYVVTRVHLLTPDYKVMVISLA